jgi:hypothetical protein
MVKVYGGTHYKSKRYMKGYGHRVVYQRGDGMGQVAYASGKAFAKKAIPIAKKIWKNLTPEAKEAILNAGINVAITGASKVGSKVSEGFEYLGEKAEGKLSKLLGKSASKTISKEAKTIIKKMVKEAKKTGSKKIKSTALPSQLTQNLSKKEQQQLKSGSQAVLSKLLAGRGLRLM